MPSPTVLYVVAAIAIALLFVWVALVWKNVDVAWEATPEERARFAKAPVEGEEDTAEDQEEPPAPAKKKSKKAKPSKEASIETPGSGDDTATAATDDKDEATSDTASAAAEKDKPADT